MSLPQGINHRLTAGFVTDDANEDYMIPSRGAYPWTTLQGNNVGYENAVNIAGRDRNSGNDRRLAGLTFVDDLVERPFRIDTAAGNYRVGLGAGDPNYATERVVWVEDSGGFIIELCNGTTSAPNQFFDATGAEYSAANWPSSQTLVDVTIEGTFIRFFTEHDGVGTQQALSHVYIEEGDNPVGQTPAGSLLLMFQ